MPSNERLIELVNSNAEAMKQGLDSRDEIIKKLDQNVQALNLRCQMLETRFSQIQATLQAALQAKVGKGSS